MLLRKATGSLTSEIFEWDPDKKRYASKGAAVAAALTLRRAGVFSKARAYRCTCGGWHLTRSL